MFSTSSCIKSNRSRPTENVLYKTIHVQLNKNIKNVKRESKTQVIDNNATNLFVGMGVLVTYLFINIIINNNCFC